MREKVIRAAVDGFLGDDVLTLLCQSLYRIGDRRRAGSDSKSRYAALERRDALLKHALGGVGQTTVDIACVSQTEAVGGVLGVVENVGSGGVDRDGARIGCGIGLFLANVKL